MKTAMTYFRVEDAELARIRLETHGIQAFVADQSLNIIEPLAISAMGGYRLQVEDSHFENARAILETMEQASGDATRLGDELPDELAHEDEPRDLPQPATEGQLAVKAAGGWCFVGVIVPPIGLPGSIYYTFRASRAEDTPRWQIIMLLIGIALQVLAAFQSYERWVHS